MYGKFEKTYRSKRSGKLVFMYSVHGTATELDAYRDAQGINLRETEEGTPLFYSSKFVTNRVELLCTSEGKIIADTSEFDKMASLAEQHGGNLGVEIARAAAQTLLGFSGYAAPAAVAQVAPTTGKDNAVEAPETPTGEPAVEPEADLNAPF